MPARPDRYEAAAVPNGFRRPAAAADGEAGVRPAFPVPWVGRCDVGEAATRAGEVAFSRPAPDAPPLAPATAPGVT